MNLILIGNSADLSIFCSQVPGFRPNRISTYPTLGLCIDEARTIHAQQAKGEAVLIVIAMNSCTDASPELVERAKRLFPDIPTFCWFSGLDTFYVSRPYMKLPVAIIKGDKAIAGAVMPLVPEESRWSSTMESAAVQDVGVMLLHPQCAIPSVAQWN